MAQQATNASCHAFGSSISCSGAITDYGTQQQPAFDQDQTFTHAPDTAAADAVDMPAFSKGVKKFCAAHPGQPWEYTSKEDGSVMSYGNCPSDKNKALDAANSFMTRHPEYVPGQANSELMAEFLSAHGLDPRQEKSYEIAFKDLKKSGKLTLYTK